MSLTLEETNSLVAALGVKIPESILVEKAKAEEFKLRRDKLAAEAGGKPADWRLKTDFDAVLKHAADAAGQKQFDAALKLLDKAGQLLQQPDAPPPTPEPEPTTAPSPAPPEGAKSGEKVLFAQARLKWETARKQARVELEKLVAALRAEFEREPDFSTIEGAIQQFVVAFEGLDERLLDKLDEAYNAATPAAERAFRKQAAVIVKEHQAFVANNKLLSGVDNNPILPVQVAGSLKSALDELAGLLG
jgi:hypothetical protein